MASIKETQIPDESYRNMHGNCTCTCGHRKAKHDDTRYCSVCACKRFDIMTKPRISKQPRRKVTIPQPATIDYEDATNTGGSEWSTCMYFDDTEDIPAGCVERGYNLATIEVPLQTVDVTWRAGKRGFTEQHTRPAAHPSERGCYTTMPLVLCIKHAIHLAERVVQYRTEELAS